MQINTLERLVTLGSGVNRRKIKSQKRFVRTEWFSLPSEFKEYPRKFKPKWGIWDRLSKDIYSRTSGDGKNIYFWNLGHEDYTNTQVLFWPDEDLELKQLLSYFRELHDDMTDDIWSYSVKYLWLRKKYTVAFAKKNGDIGFVSKYSHLEHTYAPHGWTAFKRLFIAASGVKPMYLKFHYVSGPIMEYIEDFYGDDFMRGNPFEDPKSFAFPFKGLTYDHLMCVYQMPERWDLLKYAMEKKMRPMDFLDYVANFIFCYNEDKGMEIFYLCIPQYLPPYIVDCRRLGIKPDSTDGSHFRKARNEVRIPIEEIRKEEMASGEALNYKDAVGTNE